MHKKHTYILLLFFIGIYTTSAQCAMCRAALESEETGVPAEAINDGIVYLMIFPYLLLAVLGYVIYRIMNKKKKK